jgi:hypothetical protein
MRSILPAVLAIFSIVEPVSAQSISRSCERQVASWVAACAERVDLDFSLQACPPGRVIVSVELDSGDVAVEMGTATSSSMWRALGVGVSLIGSFPDISREGARTVVLDALIVCIEADPSLPIPGIGQDERVPGSLPRGVAFPWLLFGGLVFAIAALVRRTRAGGLLERVSRRDAVFLAGLTVVCWVGRWLTLPHTFFHQNGQGPHWVSLALEDVHGLSSYGPGYAEVLGFVTRFAPESPDLAIFAAMSLFSALLPVAAWVISRRLGAGRWVAAIAAIGLAVDPILGRLAISESYFGIQITLYFGATVLLSLSSDEDPRHIDFWLSVVGAGLLVSQAVRIHPLAWAPALVVPGLVLLHDLTPRARVARAGLVLLTMSAVVGVSSGDILADVINGPLGRQWLTETAICLTAPPWGWIAVLGPAAALAVYSRQSNAVFAVGVACAALATCLLSNLINEQDADWYSVAYVWQFAPVLVGAWACFCRTGRRRRLRTAATAASVLLVAGIALSNGTSYAVPTDALEQHWALQWRETLPAEARVMYVGRAGGRVFMLPLYSHFGRIGAPVSAGEMPVQPREPPLYYYRSSLCSVPHVAATCADLEASFDLELIDSRRLPSIASQPWHGLPDGAIDVSLYRVR